MSDDREQHDSDGLEALASGLKANEADEPEEDLDLASLAAVTGARATSPGEQKAPEASDRPVPASSPNALPAAPAPAPAPAPAAGRGMVVPALLVFAVAVGVGGYLLGRSARPKDAAQAPAAQAPAALPSSSAPAAELAEPADAPSSPEQAQPGAVQAATPAVEPAPSAQARRTPVAGRSEPPPKPSAVAAEAPVSSPPVAAAPVGPEPVEKPAEPQAALAKAGPAPNRSMDQLLDDALTGSALPMLAPNAPAPAQPPAELPEAPTREEVTQAMAVLLPAIRGCAMGQTGLATAGIVVRGDGRVASVELTGAPFEGTASGRCMEGVLRRARFSRFRQPTFRVRFPFAIQ